MKKSAARNVGRTPKRGSGADVPSPSPAPSTTKSGSEADTPVPSRLRQVRKRRQAIIDAAARVFYEKGYDAASTQDIADAVGILKGSLYYYVDSKEEFLFEVIREAHQLVMPLLEGVRVSDASAPEKLRMLISAHMNYYVANRIKATVYFREYTVLSEERRTEIESVGHHYRDFVTQVLKQGQKEGTLRLGVPPAVAAIALIEVLNSISRWYDPSGKVKPAAIINHYVTMLVDGLSIAHD